MPRHEYLAGGIFDTMLQEIPGSLVLGRCKVLSLPEIVIKLSGENSKN
jgi:hypothetical protein